MNTDKWTNKIDTITGGFKDTIGKCTAEQLNWKPTNDIWSISENIDHLILINESYYPVHFEQAKELLPLMKHAIE